VPLSATSQEQVTFHILAYVDCLERPPLELFMSCSQGAMQFWLVVLVLSDRRKASLIVTHSRDVSGFPSEASTQAPIRYVRRFIVVCKTMALHSVSTPSSAKNTPECEHARPNGPCQCDRGDLAKQEPRQQLPCVRVIRWQRISRCSFPSQPCLEQPQRKVRRDKS